MSTVTSSANTVVNVQRKTAFALVATTAAATLTPTRALLGQAFLQVTVAGGTTGSGTVQLVGTAPGGAALSETLAFAANGTQVTTKRFATLTSVVTTGLATEATVPTVAVQAVSADGTPQFMLVTVAEAKLAVLGWSGWLKTPAYNQGTKIEDAATFLFDYEETWAPAPQDYIVEQGTGHQWLVDGVREIRVGFGVRPHHWHLRCTRYDT